ncbi:hypothetical protein B0T14DRAFT_293760 [Immersiella caudata]|uniref:Uncharacterized protein n=1 Tax=Immersiella caudata TaxID=314043 RepID=A0AA39WEQ9_9PEZI|nr:hypothetical protein B0T14DRAFT_293760 [Immersiella caudata]
MPVIDLGFSASERLCKMQQETRSTETCWSIGICRSVRSPGSNECLQWCSAILATKAKAGFIAGLLDPGDCALYPAGEYHWALIDSGRIRLEASLFLRGLRKSAPRSVCCASCRQRLPFDAPTDLTGTSSCLRRGGVQCELRDHSQGGHRKKGSDDFLVQFTCNGNSPRAMCYYVTEGMPLITSCRPLFFTFGFAMKDLGKSYENLHCFFLFSASACPPPCSTFEHITSPGEHHSAQGHNRETAVTRKANILLR